MRFFKFFTFILLLFFSYNVFAQTRHTPLKVGDVNISGGISAGSSSGLEVAGAAAGGVALASGAAVGALLGGPIGAALGAAFVRTLTNAANRESSFNMILRAFTSISSGSWFSPVFNMLFNASNQLTTAINDELETDVTKLLALMMAFYLLYVATKYIVSFAPIEPAKFLSEIFFPVGRMIIAVILIRNWPYVFTDILSPILNLAITFGTDIIRAMNSESIGSGATMQTLTATCTVETEGTGLSVDVCSSLQTFLANVASSLIVWMAFGATLIADCWDKGVGFIIHLPSFKMLSIGLIVLVFSFLIFVSFPLKLLDAMFRLMFIAALFPLWCLFWVIPQTRNYFKEMIKLLINVMATFLSASVVLVMVIAILTNLFRGINLDEIIRLLQADQAEEAMERIGFTTSGLFFSTCLLFMAFHLVSKIEYFANLFSKQDSLGVGEKAATFTMAAAALTPKAVNIGKNAVKWGAGKVQEGINRHNAKNYNENVPGGTARKSPRLWTAAIPGTGLWDAHQAKKAIGTYARTKDVVASGVETASDGSTTQTYSNRTVDKNGNVLAQMKETTSSNADKTKQSVDRHTAHMDEVGNIRKTTDVKKDFDGGNAARKITTTIDKNGNKVVMSVDKSTGKRTKMTYDPDNTLKSIMEETRDSSGTRRTTVRGADGKLISQRTMDKKGNLDETNFEADGTTVKSTNQVRIDAATGRRTTTYSEPSGFRKETIQDRDDTKIKETTHRADGTERVDDFKPKVDGKVPGFIRKETDARGSITEHWDVDTNRDEFYDIRGGRRTKMTERWSDYSARRP